ncbi:Glutarate-semialdehyde dehydrogenase DavD [compost metagenome]
MQLNDPQLFRQRTYIDGAKIDADNGQALKVNNPAIGGIVSHMPKIGANETHRATEAAETLPAWRALTAKERANKLLKWLEQIIANQTTWQG